MVFQLIHERTVRRIKSEYKIYKDEWDGEAGQIILPPASSPRHAHLAVVSTHLEWEMQRLRKIADELEQSGGDWSLEDVARRFVPSTDTSHSVFNFIHAQVQRKRQLGKARSSETYQTTLNSFMRFRKGMDLTFAMINGEMMELYEAEMLGQGLSRNTTSFYMRILRTNYRMAVEKGLTQDVRPFKHVYCGKDKTVKRCISLAEIKRIKGLDLSQQPVLDYARDVFLFSFYTRGMSFIDMAYLKKKDLKNGYLSYRRKKTGQLLTIEWTAQMEAILEKYEANDTQYLLPIITKEDGTERNQYLSQMRKINRKLKVISTYAKLAVPLSLYYSRHKWVYLNFTNV